MSFAINAQVTITGSDINPTVSDEFTFVNGSFQSEGPSGGNQTWDFSSVTGSNTFNNSYGSSSFPNANLVEYNDGGTEIHYNVNNSTREIHRMVAGGVTIDYSNPMTVFELPLSMGTSGNDNFESSFFSGVQFERTGTTDWEVDGWGTLITPAGTFNDVIRVKMNQEILDDGGAMQVESNFEIYHWYKAGTNSPLLVVTYSETTIVGTPPQAAQVLQYLDLPLSTSDSYIDEAKIYPNPVQDNMYIDIKNENVQSIRIIDIQGKEHLNTSFLPSINLSELDGGIYFVELLGSNHSILSRNKFIKL